MTELELTLKALEAGILPSFNSADIKKLLETCEPQEARKMKRKFRKLWRKHLRREIHEVTTTPSEDHALATRIKESYKVPARRRQRVKSALKND